MLFRKPARRMRDEFGLEYAGRRTDAAYRAREHESAQHAFAGDLFFPRERYTAVSGRCGDKVVYEGRKHRARGVARRDDYFPVAQGQQIRLERHRNRPRLAGLERERCRRKVARARGFVEAELAKNAMI